MSIFHQFVFNVSIHCFSTTVHGVNEFQKALFCSIKSQHQQKHREPGMVLTQNSEGTSVRVFVLERHWGTEGHGEETSAQQLQPISAFCTIIFSSVIHTHTHTLRHTHTHTEEPSHAEVRKSMVWAALKYRALNRFIWASHQNRYFQTVGGTWSFCVHNSSQSWDHKSRKSNRIIWNDVWEIYVAINLNYLQNTLNPDESEFHISSGVSLRPHKCTMFLI